GGVPNSSGPIAGGSRDVLAIRAPGQTFDGARVAPKQGHLAPSGHIPNPGCHVLRCAGKAKAVRAECHGGDGSRVSAKDEKAFPGPRVPDFDGCIGTCTGDTCTFRAVNHSVNNTGPCMQGAPEATANGIPDQYVVRRGRYPPTVGGVGQISY